MRNVRHGCARQCVHRGCGKGMRGEIPEPLLAEPEVWEAAEAWRDQLAGPPRLAEDVFSWTPGGTSSEADIG